MDSLTTQVDALDWTALSNMMDERGYALTPALLPPGTCDQLARFYDGREGFRWTVVMARHGFGRGEYRYFAYPLPPTVAALRTALYPHLATIANQWSARLSQTLSGRQAIRRSSTAAMPLASHDRLRFCFPTGRATITVSTRIYTARSISRCKQSSCSARRQYSGGALTLVENQQRMQSRVEVIPIMQGQIAIIPVRERPRPSTHGWSRSAVRHGVSTILSGRRQTLGIIFHDAT